MEEYKNVDSAALGLIELPNLADAIEALDLMLKTADVKLLTWEKALGGRLVTIILSGGIAAVTEAVDTAKRNAKGKIVASAVIGRPHNEILKIAMRSAKKNGVSYDG